MKTWLKRLIFLSIILTNCSSLYISEEKCITNNFKISGKIEVENQARDVIWHPKKDFFGLCNKNGKKGMNEVIIYEINNLEQPIVDFSIDGDMALDYAWKKRYLAVATHNEQEGIQIFDRKTNWTKVLSFDTGTKSHSIEWIKNGKYLLSEYLDETKVPHESSLIVFNCKSRNPNNWHIEKHFNNIIGTDMFFMKVSKNNKYLGFSSNDKNYNDNQIHIWDISKNRPHKWHELFVLHNHISLSFSMSGNLFSSFDLIENKLKVYYSNNGSLLYSFSGVKEGDIEFHPKKEKILTIEQDSEILFINIKTHKNVSCLSGCNDIEKISYNKNGKYLALSSRMQHVFTFLELKRSIYKFRKINK